MYSNLRNQSELYELQLKLGEVCQGENYVKNYFHILNFNDVYEWKNTDDCNYIKEENLRIFKFLAGLNADFDEI